MSTFPSSFSNFCFIILQLCCLVHTHLGIVFLHGELIPLSNVTLCPCSEVCYIWYLHSNTFKKKKKSMINLFLIQNLFLLCWSIWLDNHFNHSVTSCLLIDAFIYFKVIFDTSVLNSSFVSYFSISFFLSFLSYFNIF